MTDKNADGLLKSLISTSDLHTFLERNHDIYDSHCFCDLLTELFDKSGLTKASLSIKSKTSDIYLYYIFSGLRSPSRDRILCLCFGLSCTLEETQMLLMEAGVAPLYPKNRRDAIIIYYLINGYSIDELNEMLCSKNEKCLG